jgi:2-phosphosulfolactate phosphatase
VQPARITAEWGLHGVDAAKRSKAAVTIIVDVLSFSTCVDVAISRRAMVVPFPHGDIDAAAREATRLGARLAYPRNAGQQLSLSPASLATLAATDRVLLPSPNGSMLSHAAAASTGHVLCGALRNARAVAAAALQLAGNDGCIAVIAAGERWPDKTLRPAIEDLLGAGAILAALTMADADLSAEAHLFAHAARTSDVAALVRASVSGRELIDRGYGVDVDMAVDRDCSDAVPILRDGCYQRL